MSTTTTLPLAGKSALVTGAARSIRCRDRAHLMSFPDRVRSALNNSMRTALKKCNSQPKAATLRRTIQREEMHNRTWSIF